MKATHTARLESRCGKRFCRRAVCVVAPALMMAVLSTGAKAQSGAYSNITQYMLPSADSDSPGITTGPDGALWFTEYFTSQIGRITTSGAITEYPLPPGFTPNFITAGPDGALWFTGLQSNQIGRITTGGAVTAYSLPFDGGQPDGIAAGPDGALWFAEVGPNLIGRVTTTGEMSSYPVPTQNSAPGFIAAGSDGALWFTEQDASKIGRITTSGSITEYPLQPANSDPGGITAGPDGALWFVVDGGIGRITTDGVITEYPNPNPNSGDGFGITNGSDGHLWFTNNNFNPIGRAPVCGLGFSASFSTSTLTMNFNLGIDTPATFDIRLHSSAGVSQPFSKQVPAVTPTQAFTLTWTGITDLGSVTVQPQLASTAGPVICSEWTTVNTAQVQNSSFKPN